MYDSVFGRDIFDKLRHFVVITLAHGLIFSVSRQRRKKMKNIDEYYDRHKDVTFLFNRDSHYQF